MATYRRIRDESSFPYILADSPGTDGVPRQVIVFRLRPVGQHVDGAIGAAPLPNPSAAAPAVQSEDIPTTDELEVERMVAEGYVASAPTEPIAHVRREAALVVRYKHFLEGQQRKCGRHRIRAPGEITALFSDLFDYSRNELVEAKASSSRNSVRMGLGQLLDYARYVTHERRALLLPSKPRDDLMDLLQRYGCGCIWETSPGVFSRSPSTPTERSG